MVIVETVSGIERAVNIEPLAQKDYSVILKSRFYFDWKTEKQNEVFKISIKGEEEILGLISLIEHVDKRIEINLLSVSKENRGKNKKYAGIAGNLIAWACREAVKRFAEDACVSLIPKTKLRNYYIQEYGMIRAGKSLFLSDGALLAVLNRFGL